MAVQTKKFITPEEYLATEREANFKSEYYQGEVFALAGTGNNHNIITANLIIALGNNFRGKNCRVYPSDMRLHIPLNGLYTYPDVLAVCGEKQFLDEKKDTILNPVLIVEVLSPSTADYDRGTKFMLYRSIVSLQHYLLVDSRTCHVEKYTKNLDNTWVLTEERDRNAVLTFTNPGFEIALAAIYEDTELA
ncbi:Uma2 family endonuclease [Adhaeribacter swui]|uniref:Uma2 family endonuclease n=1 Tax=Adhaeribacter swui TaxID=2086471 RepID=A0A7G7G3F6_9BACT|nr:Uma2 family endonuclease [Adhaeribacter swui]QNF31690.1 Uma2 family endonuclease [Adhaeribacter swui]